MAFLDHTHKASPLTRIGGRGLSPDTSETLNTTSKIRTIANTLLYDIGLAIRQGKLTVENKVKARVAGSATVLGSVVSVAIFAISSGFIKLPPISAASVTENSEPNKVLEVKPTEKPEQIATIAAVLPTVEPTNTPEPTKTALPTATLPPTVEPSPTPIVEKVKVSDGIQFNKDTNLISIKGINGEIEKSITISGTNILKFEVASVTKEATNTLVLKLSIDNKVNTFKIKLGEKNEEITVAPYSFRGGNVLFNGRILVASEENKEKKLIDRIMFLAGKLDEAKIAAKIKKEAAKPSFTFTNNMIIFARTLMRPYWGVNEERNRVIELNTSEYPEVGRMTGIFFGEQLTENSETQITDYVNFLKNNATVLGIKNITVEELKMRASGLDNSTIMGDLGINSRRISFTDSETGEIFSVDTSPYIEDSGELSAKIRAQKEPLPAYVSILGNLTASLPETEDPSNMTAKVLLESMR